MNTDMEDLRLHIGGTEPKEGWKILNIQPGPTIDFVGNCNDLSMFQNNSVKEIYASHIIEHLDYKHELKAVLTEFYRILKPQGIFRVSVPDMDILCQMFLHPDLNVDEKFHIMRIMFGGHIDSHDYHQIGLNWDFMKNFLEEAGFSEIKRVHEFKLFNDSSSLRVFGDNLISLNIEAVK